MRSLPRVAPALAPSVAATSRRDCWVAKSGEGGACDAMTTASEANYATRVDGAPGMAAATQSQMEAEGSVELAWPLRCHLCACVRVHRRMCHNQRTLPIHCPGFYSPLRPPPLIREHSVLHSRPSPSPSRISSRFPNMSPRGRRPGTHRHGTHS